MSCDDQISSTDLENAKDDVTTIAEVATSRVGGDSGGAFIDSTTTRHGDAVSTLRGQLAKLGYEPPIAHSSGISFTVDDGSKTIEEGGLVYAPLISALPFTTTSDFSADKSNFRLLIPSVDYVSDYTELAALDVAALVDGQTITVTDEGIGGQGVLRNVVGHGFTYTEGVIVRIDDDWFWERIYFYGVKASWFFAVGDDSTDNTSFIQEAIDFVNSMSGGVVLLEKGIYRYTRLNPKSHVIVKGEGPGNTFLKCTDSSSTDAGVAFGSSIRKLDDNSRVSRFALQDIGIIADDQAAFSNVIAINLCACERGDHRNVFIAGFGYGAVVFARAEGGAEGLGFTGTAGQDGNYNTLSQVSTANCGEYNPDGAVFWYLYKANSNKSYGIFGKGGIDNLLVLKNGNDNAIYGGTAEACANIATFDGALVRSNQVSNIRGEGLSGNAYNLLNGASDNLILPGRMTGIGGVNFNVDLATENLNRIIGAEVNNLRSNTFPPTADYSSDHNKGAMQLVSANGSPAYPLFIKSEDYDTSASYPKVVLYNDVQSAEDGQVLGEIAWHTSDSSGSAAGESAAIRAEIENSVGGTAVIIATGSGTAQVDQIRIDRFGNTLAENDNAQALGGASNRWSQVFSGNGTINTSDAREKTEVLPLSADEIEAAKLISKEIGGYKWLSSVAAKGEEARYHVGLTVQRAIEIMESCGLDAMSYGFICYDEWEDQYRGVFNEIEIEDEDGNIRKARTYTGEQKLAIEAGNRYGFRYDQLLAFIVAGIEERLTEAGI